MAAIRDFLLARPEVSGTAIGAHGYCMGGRLALVAAGGMGGKMAAAGSFHGKASPSPTTRTARTRRLTEIDAAVFVAGWDGDPGFTAEQAELLDGALSAAGVEHTVESWPGGHGFAVADMPVDDAALDERHWGCRAPWTGRGSPSVTQLANENAAKRL